MDCVFEIGDTLFYKHIPRSRLSDLRRYFRFESGKFVLDLSRIDGNLDDASKDIARLLGEDWLDVRNAVERAIRLELEKWEAKLREQLRELLEAGVFAVVPARIPVDDRIANKIFSKVGDLYLLDPGKLSEVLIKKNIRRSKDVVELVKWAMNSSGLKYYDFHLKWLEENSESILESAVREYRYRTSVILTDTGTDVELTFGRMLSPEELSILRRAFTTVYYTQDSMGNLIPRRLTVLKYDRNRRRYRIPYFAVPHLLRVAKKLGFENVVDKVNWVSREIPPPQKVDVRLYKFQAQALNAWLDAGCRGTIVIPTGGGKTYIGLVAIGYLSVPTLICVTTIELARQWIQKIEEHLGIKACLLGGGKHEIGDVTVAIYNSAVKHIDKLVDKFDFIIFDECHHVPADSFRKIAFRLKARKRLGLSATPKRIDRNEALIFFSVGDVVYKAKYDEMVRLKLASPLKYYRFYVSLTPEERTQYAQANELPNSNPAKVQKLMKIAFNAEQKYEVLKKLIQKLPEDKILVFCQYVDQARKAYKAIKDVAKGQVVLLTGSTKADLRKRYFEQFKEGKKRIIVTTTVLDEGIDVPDAETAIILSGSGTERQMIQRIGRIIRYRPNKVAKVIEIVAKNTIEERISIRRAKVLKDYGVKVN